MDGFFDFVKRIKIFAAYPAVFAAAGLFGVHLLSLFHFVEGNVFDFAGMLFGVLFCAFAIYESCRSMKKAAAAVSVLLISDAVFSASVSTHFSFVFCILLTLLFWLVFSNADLLLGFLISLLSGVLLSVALVLMRDSYTELLRAFASAIKGRGATFGVLSNVMNLVFGSGFDALFYHKAYAATTLIDGRIVTGAVDIFSASDSPMKSAAEFLGGKYFASIFIPLGVFGALYRRLNKEILFAFLFTLALSVFFGDGRLFYLLLLTVSPLLYLGSLILILISYTVCAFIDMRIGFADGGTIIELFRFMDKPVYFVFTGILVTVLSYFFTRLIAAKFHLLSSNELPRSVRRLVASLGGRRNILKLENGCVIVANPNLIDILSVDCEIHENRITLLPDDFKRLSAAPLLSE